VANAGNDTLIGGLCSDTLTGGFGNDVFKFNSLNEIDNDTITDFTNGDKIDLKAVDANSNIAGDQAFILVSAFTGVAGQLIYEDYPEDDLYLLSGDTNGDKFADFSINLYKPFSFSSTDFIL
jgi:Ca2+-binding RTX toxin-like protein